MGAVVLHCSLPETRGLSPEEVARQFHTRYARSRRPRRHSRRQPGQTSRGYVTLRLRECFIVSEYVCEPGWLQGRGDDGRASVVRVRRGAGRGAGYQLPLHCSPRQLMTVRR